MKNLSVSMFITVFLLSILCHCTPATRQVKADFSISPNGSDSNPGTYEKPFATVTRARNAVRTMISAGLNEDVTVIIRGGMYYTEESLAFGPEDSGNSEYSITYRAYPGERVSLVGGMVITKWKIFRDNIWETNIPEGIKPVKFFSENDGQNREGSALFGAGLRTMQVFENGKRLELARHPNSGYFLAGKPDDTHIHRLQYLESDFDPIGWDFKDASVYLWPTHDWFSQLQPVKTIHRQETYIELGMNTLWGKLNENGGDRYFIRNSMQFLDTPGEYYVNSTERKIYLWPGNGNVEGNNYVFASADHVIEIRGSSPNRLVRNLHFRDIDLSVSNSDVVFITGAENCSIVNCMIENGHENGIQLKDHAQHIRIYGNLIRHIGLYAVLLEGVQHTEPGCPDVNHHNIIENNHIHHCGELYGHGYAVMLYQSGYNRVVHNNMHNMPRFAVMIKTMRFQSLREQIEGVTWENHWDFLHSRNNLIAYNRMHHTMQDSEDAGAIDSWGAGRENVYDHNLVYETGNEYCRWMGGIYIDDSCDYYTVSNNIIWGINGSYGNQVLYTKGVGAKIYNNILIIPPGKSNAIRIFAMAGERNDDLEFTRNIVYFKSNQGAIYDHASWSDNQVRVSDYNLYWKPKGDFVWSTGKLSLTFDEWRRLLNGKYDQHSVFADPLFVDLANGDFRLKPESPALKLGFQPIDTSEIGLRDGFPARFGRD